MKFDLNVCVDQVGFRQGFIVGFIVGFRAEERSGMFFSRSGINLEIPLCSVFFYNTQYMSRFASKCRTKRKLIGLAERN